MYRGTMIRAFGTRRHHSIQWNGAEGESFSVSASEERG